MPERFEIGDKHGSWQVLEVFESPQGFRYRVLCTECNETVNIKTHCKLIRARQCRSCSNRKRYKEKFLPTPEEIKAECEKIQAEWTPATERSRKLVHQPKWTVPEVVIGEL